MAEQLFIERGYAAVSMNDLAAALKMQKASLYHHAPDGKEALYVEIMERVLARYQQGLQDSIRAAEPSFRAQLRAAAHWLLDRPSLHYARMMQADMPELSPENAQRLRRVVYMSLLVPLEAIFAPEMAGRGLDVAKKTHVAGAFLSVIEGIQNLPEAFLQESRLDIANYLIAVLFLPPGRDLQT
jgi:AcrR family transcriptional regulator